MDWPFRAPGPQLLAAKHIKAGGGFSIMPNDGMISHKHSSLMPLWVEKSAVAAARPVVAPSSVLVKALEAIPGVKQSIHGLHLPRYLAARSVPTPSALYRATGHRPMPRCNRHARPGAASAACNVSSRRPFNRWDVVRCPEALLIGSH